MVKSNQLLRKSVVLLILFYRYLISPLLGPHCRFYPSCSVYAQAVIQEYGVLKGLFLTIKRLLCCHPWHSGGFYPIPKNKKHTLEK